jgi:uncharacterized protein (TIGR02646 family)
LIRVAKPDSAPKILRDEDSSGPKATKKLREDYDSGQREFEFKSSIYAAKSVKNALIKAQSKKCCFCESRITHIDYGDVEHFRPKGGFRQQRGEPLTKPGYFWLAYQWSNLFLSCSLCNQRYKENVFPLADQSKRARSHHDDVADEAPLFIHPSDDDPREFIGFREEIIYAIDGNDRGTVTIRELGLDRDDLNEMRRERLMAAMRSLRIVDALKRLLEQSGTLAPELEGLLEENAAAIEEYLAPHAEYSLMLQDALS